MVFTRLREKIGDYKRWALGQERLKQKQAQLDTVMKECNNAGKGREDVGNSLERQLLAMLHC